MGTLAGRLGVLTNRRFRRLLIGNSLSSFGDSALYLSLAIWAKDLTGSNAAAGAIFLAQGIPMLAAPLAGHLVDRFPRKRMLLITNSITAAAVLALVLVRSADQIWILYAVAAFYGAAFLVINSASSGLLKDLLDDDQLPAANASLATISQGLRIISPLAGAALYAQLGGAALAVLDAVTFVVAIALLAGIRVEESQPVVEHRSTLHQLLAGFRHLRATRILSQVTAAAVIAMLVLGFYESLTFAVVAELGRPPAFFGVLMSVQGVGSVIGGLAAARLIRRVGEPRTLALALLLWAVASLVYMIATLPTAYLAVFVFGIAVPLYAVALATATQRHTPARVLGRASTASSMLTNVSQTVSIAIGAALIDSIDYRWLLLIVCVVATAAALPVLARPARAEAASALAP